MRTALFENKSSLKVSHCETPQRKGSIVMSRMPEALYDYIRQDNGLARKYQAADDNYLEWMRRYMREMDECYKRQIMNRPVVVLLQLDPEAGIPSGFTYEDLKKEGLGIIEAKYNIVYIREVEEIKDDFTVLSMEHRRLISEPVSNHYGSRIGAGDIIVCGNSADNLNAYFIDQKRYMRIQHFITPSLKAKISERIDIKMEYELLEQLDKKETAISSRMEYISSCYPRLAVNIVDDKEKRKSPAKEKVSHGETPQRRSRRFSDEELSIANHTDMVDLLSFMGYTVQRVGRYYTTKEMDSIRIYNRTTYCRFLNKSGGTALNFLMDIEGMGFKEAVKKLLDFNRYTPVMDAPQKTPVTQDQEKKQFILPEKAPDYRKLYAYLVKTRGFNKETVDFFVKQGLIYESAEHHNVVFLSKDKNGKIHHAFQRGTITNAQKPFKMDVAGSNKSYGFSVANKASDTLVVTEAAIDLMSYAEVCEDLKNQSYVNMLALGGNADNPLETFLLENPHIKNIGLMLDNDEGGNIGTRAILQKYQTEEWKARGLVVEDVRFKDQYKDWNERMIGYKKEQEQTVKVNTQTMRL